MGLEILVVELPPLPNSCEVVPCPASAYQINTMFDLACRKASPLAGALGLLT